MHLMAKPMPCRICACHSPVERTNQRTLDGGNTHISQWHSVKWVSFNNILSRPLRFLVPNNVFDTNTHTRCVVHAWSRGLGCAHSTLGAKFNYLQPSGTCALVRGKQRRTKESTLTHSLARSPIHLVSSTKVFNSFFSVRFLAARSFISFVSCERVSVCERSCCPYASFKVHEIRVSRCVQWQTSGDEQIFRATHREHTKNLLAYSVLVYGIKRRRRSSAPSTMLHTHTQNSTAHRRVLK